MRDGDIILTAPIFYEKDVWVGWGSEDPRPQPSPSFTTPFSRAVARAVARAEAHSPLKDAPDKDVVGGD